MDRRKKYIVYSIIIGIMILVIMVFGHLITDEMLSTNFKEKNESPSLNHIFGTDWLGRDMFLRTVKGLKNSIVVGFYASFISSIIALIIGGLASTTSKTVDYVVKLIIDLVMGIPHLLFIILISIFVGRGEKGIILGVALTHWVSLSRIVRNEILQIRNEQYIITSRRFGKNNWYIFKNHMVPIIFPQYIVGLVLMFPHAILHEASVTFLGFGLSPESPSIGIILSESMRYLLSGSLHLFLFPGLTLVIFVILINKLGECLSLILNPYLTRI